jgi:bacterioferritin (cytochrome b1)
VASVRDVEKDVLIISGTDTSKLVVQLRALLQLTQTEAQIAQARVAQARTDAVRRELTENAGKAEERTQQIAEALRNLGGVPDVVTPAVGRVTAMVKTVTEQGEPLDGALLDDLALEYALLGRARYLKVLAQAAEDSTVRRLAERLETAHSATVDWLTTVLAEEALGGPTALNPTPIQAVAGTARRAFFFPARWYVEQVNKTVNLVKTRRDQAREKAGEAAGRANRFRSAATESLTAGRNAALQRAEKLAHRDGSGRTEKAVHDTRVETGSLNASELPIKNYDNLSVSDAVSEIKKLTKPADVRAVIGYEETHKNRTSVVSAAQTQVAGIAQKAAGISS